MESTQSQGQGDLSATLSALSGDITTLDINTATSNIDAWVSTLEDSDNEALTDIADELDNLKAALQSGDADEIADCLEALGEQTTEAASSATPDAMDQLRQLGSQLSRAASSLR